MSVKITKFERKVISEVRAAYEAGRNHKPTTEIVQSQASLTDQLKELVDIANKSGLYDAADWLRKQLTRKRP